MTNLFRSERNGKVGTKEWWLDGWDGVFDAEFQMPADIWERAVKVFQLVEIGTHPFQNDGLYQTISINQYNLMENPE